MWSTQDVTRYTCETKRIQQIRKDTEKKKKKKEKEEKKTKSIKVHWVLNKVCELKLLLLDTIEYSNIYIYLTQMKWDKWIVVWSFGWELHEMVNINECKMDIQMKDAHTKHSDYELLVYIIN